MVLVSPSRRRGRRQAHMRFSVSTIRLIMYGCSLFLLIVSFISTQLQPASRELDELVHSRDRALRKLRQTTSATDTDNNNRTTDESINESLLHSEEPRIKTPPLHGGSVPPKPSPEESSTKPPEVPDTTATTKPLENRATNGHDDSRGRPAEAAKVAAAKKHVQPKLSELESHSSKSAPILSHTKEAASIEIASPPTAVRPNTTLVATNAAQASVLHAFHTTVHTDTKAPTISPLVQTPSEPSPKHTAPVVAEIPHAQKVERPAPIPEKYVPSQTEEEASSTTTSPVASPRKPSLFVIVADSRSASDWILSRLDSHPLVCSATETGKTGFPLGTMLPDGMPWLDVSDMRQGCTLRFIRDQVEKLLEEGASVETNKLPVKCFDESNVSPDDGLKLHYPRLCRFAQKMLDEGAYDPNNREATAAAITHMYMKAYESNDGDLLACQCPEGTQVRGFKTMSDWIPRIPGFLDEHYEGLKVIRLHRRNVVARYMSLTAAVNTNIWQTHTATEKERQLQLLEEKQVEIDADDLVRQIRFMNEADQNADRWATEHVQDPAQDVLSIEYEECRDESFRCFEKIFDFIGISSRQDFIASRSDEFTSTFGGSNAAALSSILKHAPNRGFVEPILAGMKLGHFVGVTGEFEKLLHLQVVSSHDFPMHRSTKPSMGHVETTTVFLDRKGTNQPKFDVAMEALRRMPSNSDIVLSMSSPDWMVDVNHHIRSISQYYSAFLEFRSTLKKFTDQGSVVVSATDVCCAAALSHSSPGDFVSVKGKQVDRKMHACESGSPGCLWESDEKGSEWRRMFEELAGKQPKDSSTNAVYLDGTMLAGKVKDVLQLLEDLSIQGAEDERAVFADYMLHSPVLVLDYEERLFGRQFVDAKEVNSTGCFPNYVPTHGWLPDPDKAEATALFSHTPRKLGCKAEHQQKHLSFPKWGGDGIQFEPIIDHFDELFSQSESLFGIVKAYQPEILYVVGSDGISSTVKEPEPHRIVPTEEIYTNAVDILLLEAKKMGRHWPSLRKALTGAGFPFWAWFGDYKDCNYQNNINSEASTPLFTTSATRSCDYAFPGPQYMAALYAQDEPTDWYSTFQQYDRDYGWGSKIRKIVWRGTLSETDPARVFKSARWQLCQRVASQSNLADLFDVGLTQVNPALDVEIDLANAGGFKEDMPMEAFQQYTAILDMDGNSWSSRFEHLLCFNSVIIKIEPEYLDYFHYDLRPWRHYIPVKRDLSDLEEVARFVSDPTNDNILLEMIAAANHWCSEHLVTKQLAYDQLDLWERYVSLLDQGDTNWMGKWTKKLPHIYNLAKLD